MRRLLISVAVLVALTGAAQATARDTAGRKPVLAATASGLTYHVFRADPISLRPVAGGRSWSSAGFTDVSRSPDGTWLAAVGTDGSTLRFIRLSTMRSAGSVQLGYGRFVDLHPLAWLSKRLLVARFYGSLGQEVAGIDAVTRRVLWRRSLESSTSIVAAAHTADRVVLVVGRMVRSGPAQLLVIRANGAVRSIGLDRIVVASTEAPAEELRTPGLAVDPAANRAYVVDADASFAQVDLDAMTVAYRGSRTPAKVPADRARQAVWLGNGMLAVTGLDSSVATVDDGMGQFSSTPAGLYLVNAATGAARLLQRDAAAVKLVGRSLVAFGVGYGSGSGADKATGSGVTVYGIDGTPRAHFFGTTPVRDVRAQGGLAYVSLPNRTGHIAVLDPAAARVLRTISRPALQVLAG